MGRRLRLFAADLRGGFSPVAMVGMGALALIVCGGIEMAELASERGQMRSVADAAALWGANSLALTGTDGVTARTNAFADAQLDKLKQRSTMSVESSIIDLSKVPNEKKLALKVVIRGHRASFFGSMFPPGGFKVSVSSTALSVGKVPLCILGHGDKDVVKVGGTSNILATGCLVHSNENIKVDAGAKIDAGLAQAVKTASGPISPQGNSGAMSIPDPFEALDVAAPPKKGCGLITVPPLLQEVGVLDLPAGVHCGDIQVVKNATLRLAPGVHTFVDSKVRLDENSVLDGTRGSVLIFDKDSKIEFNDKAKVNLVGMKTGKYAGFLLIGSRDNDREFKIASDAVESLLGTIYIPSAKLIVEGKSDVARESAWTVIVAKQVELRGDPTLVMNTDYQIGGVPVPNGVGPYSIDSRLIK